MTTWVTALGCLGLATVTAWSGPAAAEIRIERADMIAGPLIVTGHVTPPATVTLGVGLEAIIIQPDRRGRFVWIADQTPPGCVVTASRGLERVQAGVGACGAFPGTPPLPAPVIIEGSSGADPRVTTGRR
jgi:hypothetical protein